MLDSSVRYGTIEPSVKKVFMSEFLAFLAVPMLVTGPIFLLLAFLAPELSADSPENNGGGIMSVMLAILGIAELAFAVFVLNWKMRTVRDIVDHGVEVRSKITEYTKDSATATFEFTILGKKHQARKHIFGSQTFPDPHVGQEVDLIVHQDHPDKVLIKKQYL